MQLAASLGSKGGLPPPQANLLAFEKLVELNYGVWRGGWVTGGDRGWEMVVLVCSANGNARGAIFARRSHTCGEVQGEGGLLR